MFLLRSVQKKFPWMIAITSIRQWMKTKTVYLIPATNLGTWLKREFVTGSVQFIVRNVKKCVTFISWLISLFTGCAGFLLRLFSGGLPFSISGIVLVPARSDPDHRCASVGASLAELWRVKAVTPSDSACHSVRLSPSSGASHHLSWLNMRALRAGVSAVNNRHSLDSNTSKLLVETEI